MRPFSPAPNRIHSILTGAPAGFENSLLRGAWSKDDGGQRVAVGGADRTITIWEVQNGEVLYKARNIMYYSESAVVLMRVTVTGT